MTSFTVILIMLISAWAPALAVLAVGYSGSKALKRNPSAAPKILLLLLLAFFFAEATAILEVWVVFYLFAR